MRKPSLKTSGFALPTVLVASVVMMVVMIAAVSASLSVKNSIVGQYHDTLARQAAQSGLEMAEACLEKSGGTAGWTDAVPLRPNTDCSGAALASESRYVLNQDDMRTSFEVPAPDGPVGDYEISAIGTLQLLRKSDSQPWKSSSQKLISKQDIPEISRPTAISAGPNKTCFVIDSGDVYCASANGGIGRIDLPSAARDVEVSPDGIASGGQTATPADVGDPPVFLEHKAFYACSVLVNNEVYCWGDGAGIWGAYPRMPFNDNPSNPSKVDFPSGVAVRSIELGASKACFIDTKGDVYCLSVGSSLTAVKQTLPKAAVSVAVSPSVTFQYFKGTATNLSYYRGNYWHTCALLIDGEVRCWDAGYGAGDGMYFTSTPAAPGLPNGVTVEQMSLGTNYACFTSNSGSVFCVDRSGSLSHIALPSTAKSVTVSPDGMAVVRFGDTLHHRSYYACANLTNGDVYCWGNSAQNSGLNPDLDMPFDISNPTKVNLPSGTDIRSVVLGPSIACFLTDGVDVYCLSSGISTTPTKFSLPAVVRNIVVSPINLYQAGSVSNTRFYGNDYYICAVLETNRVSCWNGSNFRVEDEDMPYGSSPSLINFPGSDNLYTP